MSDYIPFNRYMPRQQMRAEIARIYELLAHDNALPGHLEYLAKLEAAVNERRS
jgi:hypothetical protein